MYDTNARFAGFDFGSLHYEQRNKPWTGCGFKRQWAQMGVRNVEHHENVGRASDISLTLYRTVGETREQTRREDFTFTFERADAVRVAIELGGLKGLIAAAKAVAAAGDAPTSDQLAVLRGLLNERLDGVNLGQ